MEVLVNNYKLREYAAKNAVAYASKSVKNIKSVCIHEQSAQLNDNNITEYRVNAKITFEIDKTLN
ncbi:dodecin family protein [Nonlabens marinus]|uniref:dodecin family protein n=1 Tax=Nonlabens marinus TaxID=930802 RepID=UPI002934B80F|nr:dodecin family protein [Nonlabens marinus]